MDVTRRGFLGRAAALVGALGLGVKSGRPIGGAPGEETIQMRGAATDQRIYGPVLYTVSGTFAGSTIEGSQIRYKPTFVDLAIERTG